MKTISLLILLVLFLTGCQSPAAPALPPTPTPPTASPSTPTPADLTLEGSEWILTALQGKPLIDGTQITLSFQEGQAGGSSGCNSYGGAYTFEDGRLKLGDLMMTMMACETPAGVMEQEAAYADALHKAAGTAPAPVRLGADRLEILDALGQPALSFSRKPQFSMNPADLIGTAWRLENIDGEKPSYEMTLVLLSESEYSGFGGCRHLYGSYTANGDNIRFTTMMMLGPDCAANEALASAETSYTNLLSNATDYWIEEGRLVMLQSNGKTISFSPLPIDEPQTLEGTSWQLAGVILSGGEVVSSMPAVDLLPGSEITARFEGGRINGSAGCNNYFASYTSDGQSLKVQGVGATKKFCGDPEGLMRQETQYLEILGKAETFQRYPGQLWVSTGDGRTLFFGAVTQ